MGAHQIILSSFLAPVFLVFDPSSISLHSWRSAFEKSGGSWLGEGRWNPILVLAKPEGMPKASKGRNDCSMTSFFPPSWPQFQDPLFCEAALNPPGRVDFSRGSSCLSHCVVSPLDAQAKSMCHLSLYSHFQAQSLAYSGICHRLSE